MKQDPDYFAKAESWALDTRVQSARTRRAAWIVAGIAVAVALFEAVALALLTPLKTVQPVTLLVDRQTGYVQALDPLEPRRIGADAALTQSFLAQYVTAREGFDRAIAGVDYRKVALWSAERARADYLAAMPATNPASPLQRYPGGTVVTVRVKSVSRLSPSTALVRFDTQRRNRNGGTGAPQPWVSVLRYRYVDAPMALEDRLVNPLGFQVWSYRRDAEAPEPPPPPTAQPVLSAAPVPPVAVPVREAPSSPPSVRQTARPVRAAVAMPVAPMTERREVPLNQLPLGSPLVGVAP